MPTRAFLTIEDHTGETATVSWSTQDISALNFASVTQDIDEVKDAILGVIGGQVRQAGFTKTFPESFAAVNNPEAQREAKYLVVYRDTTQYLDAGNTIANQGYGKLFSMEIPTALLSMLPASSLAARSGEVDYTKPEIIELKSKIEANVRSPYNGNANAPTIAVVSIAHVGRNT